MLEISFQDKPLPGTPEIHLVGLTRQGECRWDGALCFTGVNQTNDAHASIHACPKEPE
jgi:hypothetical protein